MRISKLWQEKLKDKPYNFEYTGNITLKVDGFEIAKDWLSPELLLELEQLIEDALKDALLSNRTPYFTFKENLSLAEIRIRGIVNQRILLNLSFEKLVEKCVRRTKLPQEEVISLLSKNHPEVPHGAL